MSITRRVITNNKMTMCISFRTIILFIVISVIFSCKANHEEEEKISSPEVSRFETTGPEEEFDMKVIFYGVYLPTEMSGIFERVGANYDPSLLHSPDIFSRYDNAHSIALNIGIYGVDMSYSRLFDQSAMTAKYFSTIQLMTEKLGIPEGYFEELILKMENNISEKDSLISIATRMYEKTDKYLKQNEKDPFAALIITGGWVEALYIASEIFAANPENIEVMDRIAEQKYSLNSLITLLSNYQDDIKIAEYILLLKRLRKAFNKYEIYYAKDNFSLDTAGQQIKASEYNSDVDQEIVFEIGSLTRQIRRKFTDPVGEM